MTTSRSCTAGTTRRASRAWRVLAAAALGLLPFELLAQETAPASSPVVRHYREGEKIAYHMTASNRDIMRNLHYEADANGVVTKDAAGVFAEDLEWSKLVVDQKPVVLPTGKSAVRQSLSRDVGFTMKIPDLTKVPPMLIGPITDLLTFYADLLIATHEGKLVHAGDHFYFKHGGPNAWADGATVLVGEDSIDFDVTLAEVDATKRTATVVVKHVPPESPLIRTVAEWTGKPVADTPNNWIQVVKLGEANYLGQVGKETFEARVTIDLADGRLLTATLDNLVEVLQRPSKSADLSSPGEATRYQIVRKIEVHEVTAAAAGGK
jgi:hypothetical protein